MSSISEYDTHEQKIAE